MAKSLQVWAEILLPALTPCCSVKSMIFTFHHLCPTFLMSHLMTHFFVPSPLYTENDFGLVDHSLWFEETKMGFFRSEGVIYKPVDEIDIGPYSDEVYISPNVKGLFLFYHTHYLFYDIFIIVLFVIWECFWILKMGMMSN